MSTTPPAPRRRSIRLPRLVRLPSKSGQGESFTSYSDGTSCPNSPAVKKTYRMVVVGSAKAGKSAVVGRFLEKDFEERYLPTIENFHRKLYKIRGEVYQLDVLDRSGNDPFPAARKLSYITGDMFVLVSAVDHAQSVEQMVDIYHNGCHRRASSSSSNVTVPVVFVLNKIDLPKYKWQVTLDEVKALLNKVVPNTLDCFVACSAKDNDNVIRVFSRLFTLSKLPKFMNPESHKALRNELSADRVVGSSSPNGTSSTSNARKPVLQRMRSKFSKDNDDEIIIDVNARRPSLRTDLLLNRAKSAATTPSGLQNSKVYEINTIPSPHQQNGSALMATNNHHQINKRCNIS
ncbi:ras family domain-containing protein [Ditylenchus destructor]|nr:ras family domain-containing protein [Ditylenchus destructor]